MKQILILSVFLLATFSFTALVAQSDCTGELGPNIISNGDFGAGLSTIQSFDPFYAPNYIYQQSTAPAEGEYTIANISQLTNHDCWLNTGDNSLALNGYFMLVNIASNSEVFYQRTVEVCDGVSYLLSLDLINLRATGCLPIGILPNIDILIDGQVAFNTGDLAEGQDWQSYTQLIDIPEGSDLINIALRNNASSGIGNDVGIDNISLRHCGPAITLPNNSLVCEDGANLSIDETAVDYANPYYQWQVSFDGGAIWQDIPGENDSNLDIDQPITGVYYRVLLANGPVNFLSESCRSTSNATRLEIIQPIEVYQTPVICEGDSLIVGNEILTEAGNYTFAIPGDSGCDSLIHALLFTNPSYDHWFSQSLCTGDAFLGTVFERDTILERSFMTTAGCDSIIHYDIDVFTAENLVIETESPICQGEVATLSIDASYPEYLWSTGANTSSINVEEAGEYSISVSNTQGCSSSTSVSIQVSNPFMEVMGNDPSCPGVEDGMIEVLFYEDGIAPYTFSLDNENWTNESLFSNLAPGEHTVFLKDALGCENEQTLFINEAEELTFEILGLPEEGVESGDTLHLEVFSQEQNLTYSWSGDGMFDCLDCATVEWFPFSSGQLQVAITNSQGCSQEIDTSVRILEPLRVYIPNVFSPNGDGKNDTFAPETGTNVKAIRNWSVYDRWGGEMFAQDNRSPGDPALGWDGTWRGEALQAGIYLYRAEIAFNNGRTKIFSGEVILTK